MATKAGAILTRIEMKYFICILLLSCSSRLLAEPEAFPKCDCSRASITEAFRGTIASLGEAEVEPFRIAVRRIYLKCKSGDDFDLKSFCDSLRGKEISAIVSSGLAFNEKYRKFALNAQLTLLQSQIQLLEEFEVGSENYEEQKKYISSTLREMQRHVQGLRLPVFDDNKYFFE